MQVQPTLSTISTTSEHPIPVIVREYTSARAFHHDAQELYTRGGYTVANTTGLAHHNYVRRVLGFFGLRQEHLVITYQAPTNEWPVHAATR
jgi:FMN-dependent NADH-azoreductase